MSVALKTAVHGSGPGTPLVLLNSLGLAGRHWEAQARALGASRPVVAVDRRGHGGSPYEPVGDLDELIEDVIAALDARGIGAFDLCGLSMGGTEAIGIALAHPDRVRRLVLVDTFAEVPRELARTRLAATRQALDEHGLRPLVEQLIGGVFGGRVDDATELEAIDAMAGLGPGPFWEIMLALYDTRYDACLAEIAAPTLVVVGELDERTPVAMARDIQQAIPGATLVVLPGLGHFPHLEGPDAFTAVLSDFLGATGPTTSERN